MTSTPCERGWLVVARSSRGNNCETYDSQFEALTTNSKATTATTTTTIRCQQQHKVQYARLAVGGDLAEERGKQFRCQTVTTDRQF
eukprot:m.171244 g.171244  ORF g.171244 m.171244 type:complete len:86 (+) comp17835_c1_seq6:2707-2964(+)